MKRILTLSLLLMLAAACGKKEWPQPIATEEAIFVDHLDARMDRECMLINVKIGGNLHNLEFFMVEVEEDGCPTCPFRATFVQKVYPYDSGVRQRENSYVITLCRPFASPNLRIRLKADNTLSIVDPAISEVITIGAPVQ
jgi:hypothetical protein